MVHPMGKRPRSWYGPDDCDDGDDPQVETAHRQHQQAQWDAVYLKLSWWQRLCCNLAGEVTEPVGQSPYSGYPGYPRSQASDRIENIEGNNMKNQELLHRRGSRLNNFTRALRDACLEQGKVLVKLRNGDTRMVTYMPADANDENFEHPYEDCPDGGFRGADDFHYWQANGESITGDRFDIVEFDPIVKLVAAAAA